MSETITTTQLLDFLAKAHEVTSCHKVDYCDVRPDVRVRVTKDGIYKISIWANWHGDNDFYSRTTCITEEGHFTWEDSDFEFFTMNSVLDELLKVEEERKMKRQKRQELLSRLTDEEKELLGVN